MATICEYDLPISIFSLHFELVDERIVPEWQLPFHSHLNNSLILAGIQHNFATRELLFDVFVVKPNDFVAKLAIIDSPVLAGYP